MLVNGVETRSCVTPVSAVAGKSVTTLEGLPAWYAAQKKLAQAPALHPVQQAMLDEQAVQCGYCYNGMIVKASELLSKNPAAHRSANPYGDEWPPVPLRNISADHSSRATGVAGDGGGEGMTLRRDFLKAGGALVVGFQSARCPAWARQRRGVRWPGRPIRSRWIPGSRFMPTTPRPFTSASPNSDKAIRPRCCRWRPKSWIWI